MCGDRPERVRATTEFFTIDNRSDRNSFFGMEPDNLSY
jgi:hypothetical protein